MKGKRGEKNYTQSREINQTKKKGGEKNCQSASRVNRRTPVRANFFEFYFAINPKTRLQD